MSQALFIHPCLNPQSGSYTKLRGLVTAYVTVVLHRRIDPAFVATYTFWLLRRGRTTKQNILSSISPTPTSIRFSSNHNRFEHPRTRPGHVKDEYTVLYHIFRTCCYLSLHLQKNYTLLGFWLLEMYKKIAKLGLIFGLRNGVLILY